MNVSPAVTSRAPIQSTRLQRMGRCPLRVKVMADALVFQGIRHIRVDRDHRTNAAQRTHSRQEPEDRAPCLTIVLSVSIIRSPRRANTYGVSCVSTPPTALPIAAPIGAPAANVAKAMDRMGDGGKVCANMPS